MQLANKLLLQSSVVYPQDKGFFFDDPFLF